LLKIKHLSDGGIFAGESPLATPLAMFLVQVELFPLRSATFTAIFM